MPPRAVLAGAPKAVDVLDVVPNPPAPKSAPPGVLPNPVVVLFAPKSPVLCPPPPNPPPDVPPNPLNGGAVEVGALLPKRLPALVVAGC